jgi:Subunit ChlI of Mg-chelatase
VVRLPDNAVKESRERIKSALRNCGFEFPYGQGVTRVNCGGKSGLRLRPGASSTIAHVDGHRLQGIIAPATLPRSGPLDELIPVTPENFGNVAV